MKTAIVVGSGLAGLSAAYRLKQAGWRVSVLEKADRLCGRVITFEKQGYLIDGCATSISSAYVRYIALLREIGLGDKLVEASNIFGVVRNGEAYYVDALSPVRSFLGTPMMSWSEKARFVLGALKLKKYMRGVSLADPAGSMAYDHLSIDTLARHCFGDALIVSQGDPTQPTTMLGPQASTIQMDRVTAYLDLAPKEGATVLTGGKRAAIPGLEGGYFIEPTILAGVHNDMRIAREEIFGPVNCVIPFKDDEDAVRIANDSPYGLGGGLWTRDLGRAHRMAREIRTGTIWVNRFFNFVPGLPLGGYKESGFGREGCLETLNHYTVTKGVVINLKEGPLGMFGAPPA